FKAARAGAIHSAKMQVMENAALAVLLPVVGYQTGGGGEAYNRTRDSGDLKTAWDRMKANAYPDATSLKVVEIRICTPTTKTVSGSSVDFDDDNTMNAAQGWETMDKGKLSVQVTFHYRLVIPFANMVIWQIVRADQVSDQLLQVTRLGTPKNGAIQGIRKTNSTKVASSDSQIDTLGKSGKYFLPIRANFVQRMQSNFFPNKGGFELPGDNECIISFPKK
ncbi:MAG: hypothetical protein H6Q89_561, partial [Myxococcaceae bacterium]|nr:hypothetical protein [Myxococcaceae bacterium]